MPVWHETTKKAVKAGKLVLLGVTQEQHPERCRLFAQWKGFSWPIVHDPINVFETIAVPVVIAIDEHGIVRSTRPRPRTFARDFLDRKFADDAKGPEPSRIGPTHPPDYERSKNPLALGDARTLWGGDGQLEKAIAAYTEATKKSPRDGRGFFRLGVCLRRRYETKGRKPDDFRAAVQNWGRALELGPNQYIWRRRIEQYGPRLGKPYPFYDWVTKAEAEIRKRGEKPVPLKVRPGGAEIASPTRRFLAENAAKNPDPEGKVTRETKAVIVEAVTVPARVQPGKTARVHITFRLAPEATVKWNNESAPLLVWADPPKGWEVDKRLLRATRPSEAVSSEDRVVGFEVKMPKGATGKTTLPCYALFHVCDKGGVCRFARVDFRVVVTVRP